ncbi:MAG: hypothetical protein H6Q05_4889, partial [Acidobacteria bacterium]|nr:hypothetical protein [Acidobacteriota bacterium]
EKAGALLPSFSIYPPSSDGVECDDILPLDEPPGWHYLLLRAPGVDRCSGTGAHDADRLCTVELRVCEILQRHLRLPSPPCRSHRVSRGAIAGLDGCSCPMALSLLYLSHKARAVGGRDDRCFRKRSDLSRGSGHRNADRDAWQHVERQLRHATRELQIDDTSGWEATAGGKKLNVRESFRKNRLEGRVVIRYGPGSKKKRRERR